MNQLKCPRCGHTDFHKSNRKKNKYLRCSFCRKRVKKLYHNACNDEFYCFMSRVIQGSLQNYCHDHPSTWNHCGVVKRLVGQITADDVLERFETKIKNKKAEIISIMMTNLLKMKRICHHK